MSKNDKVRIGNFVIDKNTILSWSNIPESEGVDIKYDSKNVRAFLGKKYKHNSEINYWVTQHDWGTGKSHLMKELVENLTQRSGRIPRNEKPAKVISQPPGSFVLMVSEFLCSKKVYERVFFQSIVNMREEYFDALSEGRKEKAYWVTIRGYISLILTVIRHIAVSVFSGPVEILKSLWG